VLVKEPHSVAVTPERGGWHGLCERKGKQKTRTQKEMKMNATYTIPYGYPVHTEYEAFAAKAKEAGHAVKRAATIVGAPLLGLALVTMLPIGGLAILAWMAVKALARHAGVLKRIALFAAAPFVSLAYVIAMPFVGIGALAYYGIRAAAR
jgi:hypothetical protein